MRPPIVEMPDQADFDAEIGRLEEVLSGTIFSHRDGEDLTMIKVARRKLILLEDLRRQYARTHDRRDTLFISLAGRQTRPVAGREAILDRLKRIACAHGFINILTGFDADMNYVRKDIFSKIHKSDAFLGVWTDDFVLKRRSTSAETFGPGVWMPLELGVALSAGKECRLLLQEDLTPELLGPVSDIVQRWFTDADFEARANEAMKILREEVSSAGY